MSRIDFWSHDATVAVQIASGRDCVVVQLRDMRDGGRYSSVVLTADEAASFARNAKRLARNAKEDRA